MNERLALYGWIERHRLDAARSSALFRLAGFGEQPPALARRFWLAVAVLAAALGGLGILLWIAANWNDLGRAGRFALLQGALVATCAGAVLLPRARVPLALVAFVCIGGLFAWFGQTYQTGADPWQLFAVWAALALPLCLAVRSDVLWAPWALVVSVALSLWMHAHTGHRWRVESQDLGVFLAAWAGSALLVAALGPGARPVTGAGTWALRTAGACSLVGITVAGLVALFPSQVAPHYVLALAVLALAAAVLVKTEWFDLFLLSAIALGLDTLLVGGLARLLFHSGGGGDAVGRFLVIGLVAAGLLAASVSLVMRAARDHA